MDRVRLPGNLLPEPGKQTLLLFPTCYCTVQIFALESAALPRAPQPRLALAGRLLAPGTEDGSCSDAKPCSLLKANNRSGAGLVLRGCSVGTRNLPRSGVGRCCRSPWSPWAPARGPSSSSPSSATSTAGKSPREGDSGAGGEVSTSSHSTLGCRERGRDLQGAQGYWVSTQGSEPPQNPRRWAGDTPAEGRALGRAGKLLEGLGGKSQPFCAIFQPPFAPRNVLLAGRQQERGLWWEPGTAGGLQGRNLGQGPLRRQRRFWLCPRSPALASALPGAGPALGVWDTGLCFGE